MKCPTCGTNLPDGSAFCHNCGAQVPGAGPATAPEPVTSTAVDKRVYAAIGVGAALLVIVGSILPWAKVNVLLLGEQTISGVQGGDGAMTLFLALVSAGLCAYYVLGRGRGVGRCIAITLIGALVAVTAIADIINVQRVAREAFLAEVKVGEGLYVTLLGGIGIGLAGVLGLFLPVRSASQERARQEV